MASDQLLRALLIAACAALPACSAPGDADAAPDFNAPGPFQGSSSLTPNGSAPSGNNGGNAAPNGSSTPGASNEGQNNAAPLAPPGNGSNAGSNNGGNAGNDTAPPAMTPQPQQQTPPAMTTPPGMMTQNPPAPPPPAMTPAPANAPTPPTPPGNAFFFDDFEGSAVGEAPPLWDYFVAWNANLNNPSGNTSALVDDTRAVSGTHSVHFAGGQDPAQITLPLPAGTNKLYVRAKVFMTRQLGAIAEQSANHETLIAIRGIPGRADDEVRFGEIKGAIGTNQVPTDNISPRMDQWHTGPSVAPNQWHCFEVQFIADQAQSQLFAFVDGTMVHSITAPDQWQNGNLGGNWMAGKFVEVVLGWHSFSGTNTDVWMDDIVLSTSPIGCN